MLVGVSKQGVCVYCASVSGVRGPVVYVVTECKGRFRSIVSVYVATAPSWPADYGGLTITLRHTILGRTSLDEGPARRRHTHPTTHNVHNRQTAIFLAGFEPTIPASERPQTHALDSAATGTDRQPHYLELFIK